MLSPYRRRFVTEFSLFRYLIPELCNRQGRAIYLDSDMLCLADICELFDTPLDGCDFAAVPNAHPEIAPERWALSTLVLDCSRAAFDLQRIFSDIDNGKYTYTDFSQFGRRFRPHHNYRVRELSPVWNSFDFHDSSTRLIHYTNLDRQPWKYRYHPYGDVWFEALREALDAGAVTHDEINSSIRRGYVRHDLLLGTKGTDGLFERAQGVAYGLWLAARDQWRRVARMREGPNV